MLNSQLSLQAKLRLGDAIDQSLRRTQNRLPDLGPAFRSQHPSAADRPTYGHLRSALTEQVRRAATHAFSRAFLVAARIALLALVPLVAARREAADMTALRWPVAALVAAIALVGAYLALGGRDYAPASVPSACAPRHWHHVGSFTDLENEVALSALDGAACHLHVSQASLALAFTSTSRLRRFAERTWALDARDRRRGPLGLERAISRRPARRCRSTRSRTCCCGRPRSTCRWIS